MDSNINPIGQAFREGFLELLNQMGTDFQAGGETRKAIIEENKEERLTILKFADEFPLQAGDTIKNWATEDNFMVVEFRSASRSNTFHHFEVSVSL